MVRLLKDVLKNQMFWVGLYNDNFAINFVQNERDKCFNTTQKLSKTEKKIPFFLIFPDPKKWVLPHKFSKILGFYHIIGVVKTHKNNVLSDKIFIFNL
jgi:hypothetical protein